MQTYYDIGVAQYKVAEDYVFSSLTGMAGTLACTCC